MALKAARPAVDDLAIEPGQGLMTFLEEHGGQLMAIELVLLGIATIGAIGSDRYWQRASGGTDNANDSASDRVG